MSSFYGRYVLLLSCPDRRGIVKAVTTLIFEMGGSIAQAAQHTDPETDTFFMRVEFTVELPDSGTPLAAVKERITPLCRAYEMQWSVFDALDRPKILIAVSKHGHCLHDLLHRWKSNALLAEIVGVVSNHEDMRGIVEWHGLPYHHLPIIAGAKAEQELAILEIMRNTQAELLVLARYMQILSDQTCSEIKGGAINIHHSFLPGFKGARPYHQAYQRGVKIIGATAHYVTSDLDEGPIIEQCVERIDHQFSADELVKVGRDMECVALSRAIKWHCERRVLVNNNKTVVFR